MAVKVYGVDEATGKVIYEKPGAKKGKKAKVETDKVTITDESFNALLELAQGDGFSADGDTAQGIKAQNTRAVSRYTQMAVNRFIAFRKESGTKETAD